MSYEPASECKWVGRGRYAQSKVGERAFQPIEERFDRPADRRQSHLPSSRVRSTARPLSAREVAPCERTAHVRGPAGRLGGLGRAGGFGPAKSSRNGGLQERELIRPVGGALRFGTLRRQNTAFFWNDFNVSNVL